MEGAETEGSGLGMSVDVLSCIGCNIPYQKDGLSPPIGQPARPSPMRPPRARLKARGRPCVKMFQHWDCLLRCSDERSEEHKSALQSLMRNSQAVSCWKQNNST